MKAFTCRTIVLLVVLIIGVIALFAGLFGFHFISPIISRKVEQNKMLLNGSDAVKKWTSIKLPIYMKYHLFDVQNPDEVINGGNPVMIERGPFVFREVFKYDIDGWNEDQTVITYRKRKFYHFEPELSNGTLNDSITIISIPLLSVITKLVKGTESVGVLGRLGINAAVRRSKAEVFITKTVGELLFEGYQENIFDSFASLLQKLSPDAPKDGRFALMKNRNGSDDGVWQVNTGKGDINKFATLVTWNNQSRISCWNGSHCADIRGTDGTMYHPSIQKDEKLYLFSADVNRSVYLQYETDVDVHKIAAYKFVIPSTIFRAPYNSKENECFCSKNRDEQTQLDGQTFCSLDGVLDMSKCKKDVPLVLSLPHFYGGDKILLSRIQGLEPRKEKHENYVFIDPITGIVLSAGRRLQISANINSKLYAGIKAYQKIPDTILPVIWFEETFMITEPLADKLWSMVHKPVLKIKQYLMIAVIVGLLVIASVLLAFAWFYVRNNFNENRKSQAKETKAEYSYSDLKKGFDASQQHQSV